MIAPRDEAEGGFWGESHFVGQERQYNVFLQGNLLDPGLPAEDILTI